MRKKYPPYFHEVRSHDQMQGLRDAVGQGVLLLLSCVGPQTSLNAMRTGFPICGLGSTQFLRGLLD